MAERLTKKDWIDQGLRTLKRLGFGALKVGPLAVALDVSRGSFYWHFKDMGDFRAQLLQAWKERATDQVIQDIDAAITGAARLTALMQLAFKEDRGLDRSIRAWGGVDRAVAEGVAAVDALRIAYMAKLLVEAGVDSQRAVPRAEFLYWAYIGQSAVLDPRHTSITEGDIEDLSARFTG